MVILFLTLLFEQIKQNSDSFSSIILSIQKVFILLQHGIKICQNFNKLVGGRDPRKFFLLKDQDVILFHISTDRITMHSKRSLIQCRLNRQLNG